MTAADDRPAPRIPGLAITYPPDLPVSQRRDDIAAAIRDNQVVIVAGETGSGKTTQLPKILLELGRQRIAHTQPRRIAARTIAERIAEELGTELGGLVGYKVRFTDQVSKNTRVTLMTDGILLAALRGDRELENFDAIIIDEAHERSLTIDFLIGYLKQLLPRRPELKIIITSATIDPASFAQHFANAQGQPAPIIQVSGRTYPVEVRYRPLVPDGADTDNLTDPDSDDDGPSTPGDAIDMLDGLIAAVDELGREGDGDVLCFFSGENEIRDAADALRGHLAGQGARGQGTEVLPLYGRLSAAEQHRVFERPGPGIRRRIILATNVAETSLTVPGIRYVVDTGTARISRYSVRSKVQQLPIEPISQASANQRSGRSGRTSDGIAIRLYSETDYGKRPDYTDPEILRTNLAAVILQMISLGLGDIERFPFLQPPDKRGIKDGLDLLLELNAITTAGGENRITRIGREIAQLPLDPRYARMVVESKKHGVEREVIAIVAGLSIQDPRERPVEKRAQADQLHARFADPTSDFLTLLNLWKHLQKRQKELSGNQFRKEVRREFLNYLRIREWADVERQVRRQIKSAGKKPADGESAVNGDLVHKALLAGLLTHIGLRDDRTNKTSTAKTPKGQRPSREYLGARQRRFVLFPGSGLAKKQPDAVMAAELVETSRLFARTVAAIDPAWAEALAGDQVKRQYSEPRWEKRQGAAVVDEKVTLYGVPIIPRRRTQLARIDPEQARELFIRHALVEGDWDVSTLDKRLTAFLRTNAQVRRELEKLEERQRRRDILLDDERLIDFFEARIPADVTDVRRFERWWRDARLEHPDLLTLSRADLVEAEELPAEADADAYPTRLTLGDQTLTVGYRFEPGTADDGVTVTVPLALLPRLEEAGFDWLVPGLRHELVTALLKTLPKPIRRNVVPTADWATKLLAAVPADADVRELSLTEFLATEIRRQTYTPVDPDDFDVERLPAHLRMGYAVVDDRGKRLARGTDLGALQSKLRERTRSSVARVATAAVKSPIERGGLTAWTIDALPPHVDARRGETTIRAYPALVDEGASVAVKVLATPEEQTRAHRGGVRRLVQLSVPSPLSYIQEHLTAPEKLSLGASPYRSTAALIDDALRAVIDAELDALGTYPRDQAAFEALRDRVNAGLPDRLFGIVSTTATVLAAAREADVLISRSSSLQLMAPLADARAQLESLVFDGLIGRTGLERLPRLAVYLRGIVHRIERLADNLGRDRAWMLEHQQAVELYTAAGGTLPLAADAEPRIRDARWMLEELRLSLFAQPLGAQGPISVQRIRKQLGR